jgi:hypothetical protein
MPRIVFKMAVFFRYILRYIPFKKCSHLLHIPEISKADTSCIELRVWSYLLLTALSF